MQELKRPSESLTTFLAAVWLVIVSFTQFTDQQVAAVGGLISASSFAWSYLIDKGRDNA